MKNQHTLIKGYRDLSRAEIDLINEIKAKAEEAGALVVKLKAARYESADRPDDQVDGRWLAIGQTELQQGFMALTRAVAKPGTF